MAVKTKAPVKKPAAKAAVKKAVPAQKAAPAKKAAAARKAVKGDSLECVVCGYAVTVDEDCGCVEEHVLLCCGEPMKPRRKAAVKARK